MKFSVQVKNILWYSRARTDQNPSIITHFIASQILSSFILPTRYERPGTVRWGRPRAWHAPRMVHYTYSTHIAIHEGYEWSLMKLEPSIFNIRIRIHFVLQSATPCRLGCRESHILLWGGGGICYRPRDLPNYLLSRSAKFKTNSIVLFVNIRNQINNRPWRHWWRHRSGQVRMFSTIRAWGDWRAKHRV